MKKLVKRVVNGALSLVMTCLIMAAPVAAMIYAAEPATAVESFSIKETTPPAYADSRKTDFEADVQGEQWEADRTNYFYALTGKE